MGSTAKLSSKYQIVIPKRIRRELSLKAGDLLMMEVEKGKIIIRPQPKSYTETMLGLGKEIWEGIEATEYVRRERGSWTK